MVVMVMMVITMSVKHKNSSKKHSKLQALHPVPSELKQ